MRRTQKTFKSLNKNRLRPNFGNPFCFFRFNVSTSKLCVNFFKDNQIIKLIKIQKGPGHEGQCSKRLAPASTSRRRLLQEGTTNYIFPTDLTNKESLS